MQAHMKRPQSVIVIVSEAFWHMPLVVADVDALDRYTHTCSDKRKAEDLRTLADCLARSPDAAMVSSSGYLAHRQQVCQ